MKEQLFHFVDDLERSLDFKLDEEFDKIKCNICLVNELKKYCENNNIVFE